MNEVPTHLTGKPMSRLGMKRVGLLGQGLCMIMSRQALA
jgi:hypothetical protein